MLKGEFIVKLILGKIPSNLEEFKSMKEMDLTKVENTCAMFLCALDLFIRDRNTGVEAINILKGPVDLNPHEISFLADRVRDKAYLARMYFEGARPDNNYAPSQPLTIIFYPDGRPKDCEPGYIRLYLKTAGADAKRAIKLRQKGDQWYIWEYPGIVMDVRKPVVEDPWA